MGDIEALKDLAKQHGLLAPLLEIEEQADNSADEAEELRTRVKQLELAAAETDKKSEAEEFRTRVKQLELAAAETDKRVRGSPQPLPCLLSLLTGLG